jgi:hypothetical protein
MEPMVPLTREHPEVITLFEIHDADRTRFSPYSCGHDLVVFRAARLSAFVARARRRSRSLNRGRLRCATGGFFTVRRGADCSLGQPRWCWRWRSWAYHRGPRDIHELPLRDFHRILGRSPRGQTRARASFRILVCAGTASDCAIGLSSEFDDGEGVQDRTCKTSCTTLRKLRAIAVRAGSVPLRVSNSSDSLKVQK